MNEADLISGSRLVSTRGFLMKIQFLSFLTCKGKESEQLITQPYEVRNCPEVTCVIVSIARFRFRNKPHLALGAGGGTVSPSRQNQTRRVSLRPNDKLELGLWSCHRRLGYKYCSHLFPFFVLPSLRRYVAVRPSSLHSAVYIMAPTSEPFSIAASFEITRRALPHSLHS